MLFFSLTLLFLQVSTSDTVMIKMWNIVKSYGGRIVAITDYYGTKTIKDRMLLALQHGVEFYGFEMANEPQRFTWKTPADWPVGTPRPDGVGSTDEE
jgi:hypothetical protein